MPAAKIFIFFGLILLAIGLILQFAPWLLTWFGKLPGDIRIKGDNTFIFIPITSMLILSAVISVVLNYLIKK
ncbi:MAG: DUF2905 domain-containing protein [Candidatus Dadabacteria bacterium]|nr:MAG: DUF2905 domain-containing protein [Candidatus Dadabacteria bacterium]